jgi:hypothetical protein
VSKQFTDIFLSTQKFLKTLANSPLENNPSYDSGYSRSNDTRQSPPGKVSQNCEHLDQQFKA